MTAEQDLPQLALRHDRDTDEQQQDHPKDQPARPSHGAAPILLSGSGHRTTPA
ncbi:MAG: hypothetical protein IT537_30170 [Hyphomicrobiales bacterium]|nr:hypothetical protein [Hyphomicrobiales bacterium]